ncbi:hypothetical protein AAFC00_000773 [Neodothiora populina]|uniref:Uncharacterized protein n=1 Tax=Neodothiora populina TaxID=2781224 RepID=A0ABR3PMS0_9PEZI
MSRSSDYKEPEIGGRATGTAQPGVDDLPSDLAHDNGQTILMGEKSPGVARIEAISKHMTLYNRVALFISVFLIAYAYGLDGTIRYTYQPIALGTFGQNALISTITVVRTVIGAAAQPTAAKIADVFGRVELLYVSIFFYVLGTVIEAASTNVSGFAAGAVLYQIGYTIVTLLVEVIVADVTSLRSRLAWSYISATPFIINTWVSGDVTSSVLSVTSWKWGVGMWAIIYPFMALPLVLSLLFASQRAKKSGDLANYKTPYQQYGLKKVVVGLFWQLDVIGIILMIATFALILVPFTLAGGASSTWGRAHIIAPLVIGICLIPFFVLWERRALHPLVPFRLLKDRGVWAALGIGCMLNFAWYMQADYLYNVLIVGFNQSIKSATRILSLYSFVSVLTGCGLSLVVRFGVPYLKPFILLGTVLYMISFGILIAFRGDTGGSNVSGLIGGQCLLGFAGGLFSYPTQVSLQAATKHEHLALVTGLYLALYSIGSAFGTSVSGAIWTQLMPGKLSTQLSLVSTNATAVAAAAYADPATFATAYPVGSVERTAVIEAYREVQRLMCITGLCLCVPIVFFALALRNPRLGKEQSRPEAEEGDSIRSGESAAGGSIEKAPRGSGGAMGFARKMFK